MDNGNDYGVGDFYHTDDEDDDAGSNDKKGYDADPEDMEELMKESSSALGHTPLTVRQLVIALQNNLSESFDQDHDENDYVNISWLVVVLQSHLDLVLMC